MAETKKDEKPEQTSGNADATASQDAQVAAKAGISEGEVKALRDDAGLNQLPGSEANVLAWEQTEDGQKFIKDSKKAAKDAEESAKKTRESVDKDGLTEADKKYREALIK